MPSWDVLGLHKRMEGAQGRVIIWAQRYIDPLEGPQNA